MQTAKKQKSVYKAKRADGICVRCAHKADASHGGSVFCRTHREQNAARVAGYRKAARRKARK